ncbi:hypothetical protein [Pseudomonas amygdali]|uniref:Uncharacterized protein n=2 Tax=Pseudomonas amygdali pv. lachrymans TaxID=53707 RepID=A0ABR5KR69_PSEAV|nr:hypothetical protein [Pseudomonas amygdali]AXH59717.1 hypothetical protein PLA107_031335 [Pseudomonas amygdali pv. lachrymans str. M301315]KPC17139.1 Uncharacterized protein AC499_0341 [Pseudomonas amygdali pv. lachrymans]KPC18098.1 Uncharacterized protein AC499_1300 [Pseudomonas amygdali pv. lachrymans]RMT06117.1 hypothetical protein ALP54_03623 [Pseudomonas amygdali pv. lachrymans]
MSTQELYAITYNSDGTEGRGREVTLGYTRSRAVADEIVSDPRFAKYCVMGVHNPESCKKYNVQRANVVIFESASDLWRKEDDALRESALKKLTHQEREALGLV